MRDLQGLVLRVGNAIMLAMVDGERIPDHASGYPTWQRFCYGAALVAGAFLGYFVGLGLSCPHTASLGQEILTVPAMMAFYSFVWLPVAFAVGLFVTIPTWMLKRSRAIDVPALILLGIAIVVPFMATLNSTTRCHGGW